MFSGKREKALLEEELAALRETEKRERELLHKIAGQKDTAEEQFARMTASRAQMEKEIRLAMEDSDSIGGTVEVCALNVPAERGVVGERRAGGGRTSQYVDYNE